MPALKRWACAAHRSLGDTSLPLIAAAARAAQIAIGRAPPSLRTARSRCKHLPGAVQCRDAHRGVLVGGAEPTALDRRRRWAPRGTQDRGRHLFTRAEGGSMPTDLLRPHDHAEAVALFRAEVIGRVPIVV